MDVLIHIFSSSAIAGCEWSASRPGRFRPRERAHTIYTIGGLVDPRAGVDYLEEKNLDPAATRTPTPQSSGRYTGYAIPAPVINEGSEVMLSSAPRPDRV
jgi:hypothetical protein